MNLLITDNVKYNTSEYAFTDEYFNSLSIKNHENFSYRSVVLGLEKKYIMLQYLFYSAIKSFYAVSTFSKNQRFL